MSGTSSTGSAAPRRGEAGADADPVRRQQYRALAERLVPYVHGGTYAGLLDGPTTVRPDALLEVFNFKGLADRLVPLAMLPLIEYIWAVIADPTRPTLVVLDEGWSLLNNPASARFVAEATRTGRHHGIITLNLSQMVTDYEGPLGRAVIDNASVSLLLAQSDHALPQVQEVFHLSADERAMVGRLRTVRQVRAGAYLHSRRGADSGEISLYVTPEEYWLFTSVPAERKLRQAAIARHGGDVWAAVRELARGERATTAEDDAGRSGSWRAAHETRRGRARRRPARAAPAARRGRRGGGRPRAHARPARAPARAAGERPARPLRPGGRPGLLRGHGEPVGRGRRHHADIDPRPRLRPLGRRPHRAPDRRDQPQEPARRPGGGDPPSRAAVRGGPAPDRPVAAGEQHGHGRDQQPRQRRQHDLGRRQTVRGPVRLHARPVDDGPSVGGLSECRGGPRHLVQLRRRLLPPDRRPRRLRAHLRPVQRPGQCRRIVRRRLRAPAARSRPAARRSAGRAARPGAGEAGPRDGRLRAPPAGDERDRESDTGGGGRRRSWTSSSGAKASR